MNAPFHAALLLVSSLGLASALAPSPTQAAAPPISAVQQDAIFSEQKQLVLRDQRDRLQSLAATQRCVQAASSSSQLMGCLVQEHQQNQRISADHHAAMLAILQRHGIHPAKPSPQASGTSQP